MQGDDLTATLNAGYLCPPGAGPAWRQAVTEGVDMSLIERNLARTPWERLHQHDEALRFAQILQQAARSRDE